MEDTVCENDRLKKNYILAISPDYLSAENIAASSSTTETSLQHASTELITAHAYRKA